MTAAELIVDIRKSIEELEALRSLTRLYDARIAKRDYLIGVLMEALDRANDKTF